MNKNLSILSAIIAASVVCVAQDKSEFTSPKSRDVITLLAVEPDGEVAMALFSSKLRAFVWEHWQRRAEGVVNVKGTTTEGDSYKETFTIGPDQNGTWRIVMEASGEFFDPFRNMMKPWSKRYEAYSVTRRRPTRKEPAQPRDLPDNARLSSRLYRLVLKDRSGSVVEESL